MLIKEYFINLSIIAFLVSLAIFFRVFIFHKNVRFYHLLGGVYAGIIAVISMFFHFEHMGLICDLRVVPLILSFIYFGRTAGWITFMFIAIMRIFYLGDDWEPSVIAFLGMSVVYTFLKTYLKNLHPFKSSILNLVVYAVLIQIVFWFTPTSIVFIFDVQLIILMFMGLLIGLFLIESHQKLYHLTQDLFRTNQALVESKQELKDTVHELQGGIFKYKKRNGRFLFTLLDGQFYDRIGWNSEDVIEKDLQAVCPPLLFSEISENFQLAWEGKEVSFELPWPDNETMIFISLRPIKREEKVLEVVGSIVDITERKKMEEELLTTKQRLESFINDNIDSIYIIDLEGQVLQVNKSFERIFGWSEQEILGQKLPTIPKDLLNEAQHLYQKVVSGESITEVETVRKRKDERLIDISLTLSPIQDTKGNVVAISSISRDISKRKQTERELHRLHQQLQESEMKYRALIEQASDAVYLIELDEEQFPTRFIEVNPVGSARFESSREEILSRPFTDTVSANSRMLMKIVENIRNGKQCFTLQDEYIFKTGKKITTEFSVRVFKLGEKEVFLAISRDITERLKTEELLRKSEKLAVVGHLATAIAHEIRNPLTTIKGFVKLLQNNLNEENQYYVEFISKEIEQIEVVTNEFMAVAKPEAVKVQLNDLQLLLNQAIVLLQPQVLMNNIEIKIEIKTDIQFIYCEGIQLKQVFINILKNAIESMPTGGEVTIEINEVDNNRLSIRFIDQGCGIPKERIPFLGEPFYSIKEVGIGLGLMSCYKIVETHQGTIGIESEVEKGTIVEIILPSYYSQAHEGDPSYYTEVN
ncbi:PAS domain S-box protein [Metabacillus bambusae]|uniref:histidine kinase n=1 Tax=Metabacillus bambusae TaxID=2795218 RepID=A0ABS3N2X4_9BACI|nr:PAS domain S-box protein [Metabacillus bambusae]MBO1512495.1 PAS domain S-box protein [Metabacillus bambusae]